MLLSSQEQINRCLFIDEHQEYIAEYNGLTLMSLYQPIFDFQHSIIGFEALLRLTDHNNAPIDPDHFFNSTIYDSEFIMNVECLARIIHIKNFYRNKPNTTKLFLNLLPSIANHCHDQLAEFTLISSQLIKQTMLSTDDLVFEIIENSCEESKLMQSVMLIKSLGFRVAVDDFGSKSSNLQRVINLVPHIIKIDRRLLLDFISGQQTELEQAILLAKKVNAQIIVEGIETQHQLNAMKALGVEFFQGFFLGIPRKITSYCN
jgi:EAL domain-containing protein (putative c-di-GMP-specific phosphodiesterase class I)